MAVSQEQAAAESNATSNGSEPSQQQQQQQQQPDQEAENAAQNQLEAIKFIKTRLDQSFDEQSAKSLFEFYTLDKQTQRLQPPDVRKLLLDLLAAYEWPLVVPDESLDAVFHELCLNDEGSISWIEFKSFFVFLQDKPLTKLLEIVTKMFSKQQLCLSRLITIKPARSRSKSEDVADTSPQQAAAAENDGVANAGGGGGGNDDDDEKLAEQQQQNYYDRNKWKQAVQRLIPDATQIFIYFMDGYNILALAVGAFETALSEPAAAEVHLDDVLYLATIRAFDATSDMFPPVLRSGGMKSKVARRIADSYIIARQWDEKHLKLVEKTAKVAHSVSIKWTEFDEKYKVNERVNATTASIISSVKAFDEKHQLTRRLSAGAKSFDEKFGISDKLSSLGDKISSNEKYQMVSNKAKESLKTVVKTVDDIGVETQQLVQDKRQQQQQQQQPESEPADQAEGGVPVAPPQQYGVLNDDAVAAQVQSQ
eukprot:CAMPEP_0202702872 /NCGR_PEP_ID=MMETSP1385-20130828/15792_1 /ASSEMBLY_ACC=CAM_ASM_000861 /TAXON_ID=933848 /ORGANISM="Elphidium margaritaceum" /LENGTH=479 /DNA_ID=CAMNT_0049360609 /DNA_START=67 /DNA_END=1506 /DNA_ORIENTATION=+